MTTPDVVLWRPSTADVGAVIARYVPDTTGQVAGTFTTTTIPTSGQVEGLITRVVADVSLTVEVVPPQAFDVARDVAAVGTGLRVVESFFPDAEQVYVERLGQWFTSALERLRDNVDRLTGGPRDDAPRGHFPPAWDSGRALW